MQLFYSPNSPYARIARVAVREFGLLDRVDERKAANRQPDNPVLAFSAAGRVPTLVDGDLVLTEARYVFDYIAAKGRGAAVRDTSAIDWRERALEGQVLGFVDGIANWVRERRRPSEQQSGFLIEVEVDRSARCLDHLEGEAARQRPEFPHVQRRRPGGRAWPDGFQSAPPRLAERAPGLVALVLAMQPAPLHD
jgi:glutathione S-transferase